MQEQGAETTEGRSFKVGISWPIEVELWRNFRGRKALVEMDFQ